MLMVSVQPAGSWSGETYHRARASKPALELHQQMLTLAPPSATRSPDKPDSRVALHCVKDVGNLEKPELPSKQPRAA